MTARLDHRLAADSVHVTWLEHDIEVRLMNDQRYLWLLLIPLGAEYSELHELPDESFACLLRHAKSLSQRLKEQTKSEKVNIAALGNHVRQLHLHVIMRRIDDEAWPNPVWGKGALQKMNDEQLTTATNLIQAACC